jgi:hypothetical protein
MDLDITDDDLDTILDALLDQYASLTSDLCQAEIVRNGRDPRDLADAHPDEVGDEQATAAATIEGMDGVREVWAKLCVTPIDDALLDAYPDLLDELELASETSQKAAGRGAPR